MVSNKKKEVNSKAALDENDERFGPAPGNETLDETDTIYLSIDDDGSFHEFHDHDSDGEEREDEITKFLSVDKLPEFARMKLAAKKAKNKERLAELIELERAYKQEVSAKEKEKKAQAREDQKAAEAAFREQEKKEASARKLKERNAEMAHKVHMAALASDEPTPELVYAQTIGVMPNLAVDVRDENVALYEWAESYWKLLTKHEGKKRAFEWLEQNFPNMAGNKLAGNAYESALFKSQSLPPRPKESIIPMLNAWLFVTDDGKLLLRKPDKAWGVTYNIKAALKFNDGDRFYEPKPLPTESRFYKFITSSLPDEKERMLVQEYCGYTLTNNVKHQVAQIWEGGGSNGKSVLLEIIEKLHENAVAVNLDKLDGPEMASLKDASLAISAETPKGKLNENELKKFIAGDLVSLRNLYERAFDHHPTAKWIMSCNRFPRIQDETNAVFRRLQYIRWDVMFTGDAIIHDLHKIIIENELDIVVDWCLEGLHRLNKRGKFDPPDTVKARLEEEKIASNTVLAYITEMGYRIDPVSCNIAKNDFYRQYQEWCEESNLTLFGGTEFWKRMNSMFPQLRDPQKTVKGKRVRYINLTNTPQAEVKAEQDEIEKIFGGDES